MKALNLCTQTPARESHRERGCRAGEEIWQGGAADAFKRRDLTRLVAVSAGIALAAWPLYPPHCKIAAVGIFAGALSSLLACWGPRGLLAIPWLSVGLFVLQNLLAPLYSYWNPLADRSWPISANFPSVVATASWASLGFLLGILLPSLTGMGSLPRARFVGARGLARFGRWAMLLGYALALLVKPSAGGDLAFILHLLAMLRLVGAGVLVLTPRGGGMWLVLAVGAEFALGVMRGVMLHDFLLVSMTLLCLFALARQWRWRLAVSAAFLLLAVHLLQCCKMEFRQSAWFGRGEPVSIGRVMVSMVTAPEQIFQRERISATVARLNQGKIVEAISNHVPEVQPFAHGTTLWEAVHASLVPRLFDPSKPRGTDSERFARYTGHVLDTSTAMNLGILGEGYANFGPFGAVCTLFAYGLIFGLAYRYVLKRAACCPLWWVWFAYVFYWWPKTEGGIAASLNFTTKAALIFLAVVFISPAWRHALGLMDGRRSKALPFRPPGDGRRTPPLPGAAFLAPYEAKPRG